MNDLRNLPIRRKLTVVILTTCAVVLSLAGVALAVFEVFSFRRSIVRDSTVMADVIARNTQAALEFRDGDAAEKILQSLQAEPNIVAACLYTDDDEPLAQYTRRGHTAIFPRSPRTDGPRFGRDGLVLFHPVVLEGKRIGTLYLQADLQEMYDRVRVFVVAALLVLFVSMLVATLLSSRLQRPISRPILALTETARMVTEREDFSVRAVKEGADEIGVLTDAFNQMLGVIEERDDSLQTANATLLGEVAERERAEHKAHAQLARLELLHQITRAIGERQDLPSIFQVVIRSLEDHLPLDFSCVCLYDAASHLFTITSVGLNQAALGHELITTAEGILPIDENGLTRSTLGQLLYEPDITQLNFPFTERLVDAGLRSLLVAPLLMESRVFGVVLGARKTKFGFSSAECEFVQQLSEHVALAAHQAQLYTALQQAYDDLRQSQQTVMQQERLRALGQMASGIAHDINNSMFPVTLYTDYLLEKEENLSPRARGFLSTIQRAAKDVAHTVGRMGEFYRQRDPNPSVFAISLNGLIEQVIDLTRARWYDMAQQRSIMIEVRAELAEELPVVTGVESEFREALTNLIFNAVDAMPQGGSLTLRTSVVAKKREEDATEQQMVSVEVIDTGGGMDEETRRRCLEPFFTTKGERGTGLGLAMVYGTLQRHGADIEIDSVTGVGTTVRLLFAVATTPLDSEASSTLALIPPPLRLIIVDDDPILVASLRHILESDGHDVTAATGGREGITAFRDALQRNEPFAAVITDLGMPYVDGRKVAESVKEMSPTTPVILLTGWGQRILAEGDVPPHVDRVISKPPKLRDLRTSLALSCPRPS